MATKNGASALEFIREQLKKNPQVPFAEVKTAAEEKGFTIYPIMYGRALSLEGIVRPSTRRRARGGDGEAPRTAAPRGRSSGTTGRAARKAPAPVAGSGLDAVVAAMQKGERCRAALEEIQRILGNVL